MATYYLIHILALSMTQANGLLFMKKFQLVAGTSLRSSTVYMIINGIVSAIVPLAVLLVLGKPLQVTLYSLIMAAAIVLLSAVDTVLKLKAYEKGQMAIVNIFSIVGTLILSCLWGVFVLHESLSVLGMLAIAVMLVAVLLVSRTGKSKLDKRLLWIYLMICIAASFVSIFSKQHQVETAYATVDTLSFSVWLGVVRTVLFSFVALGLMIKNGKEGIRTPKAAAGYAVWSSLVSGTSYMLTLFTNAFLPIVITSPLGVGFGIVMSAVLPWMFYKERLNKRQLLGVVLALAGTLLFVLV